MLQINPTLERFIGKFVFSKKFRVKVVDQKLLNPRGFHMHEVLHCVLVILKILSFG